MSFLPPGLLHEVGIYKNRYNYALVRKWTEKLGYSLSQCDKIFVPVLKKNEVQNHWCLGVISIVDKEFQYLDSVGGNGDQVMENLAKYFADEMNDKNGGIDVTSWKKNNIKKLPQQHNGYDCGMFMLMYADFCCRPKPNINFDQSHIPQFRIKAALDILNMKRTDGVHSFHLRDQWCARLSFILP